MIGTSKCLLSTIAIQRKNSFYIRLKIFITFCRWRINNFIRFFFHKRCYVHHQDALIESPFLSDVFYLSYNRWKSLRISAYNLGFGCDILFISHSEMINLAGKIRKASFSYVNTYTWCFYIFSIFHENFYFICAQLLINKMPMCQVEIVEKEIARNRRQLLRILEKLTFLNECRRNASL